MNSLEELDLFHGEATNRAAYLFARLPRRPEWEGATLSGEVVGPACRHAQTLPAKLRLTDAGPGPTLLARGVVPDPSCWSPELPMLYRVRITLTRGSETLGQCERSLGIRRLGPKGKDLLLESRRYVLRAMATESVTPESAAAIDWRETGAGKIISRIDEADCREASEHGVLSVFWSMLQRVNESVARQIARHPAIAIAALSENDAESVAALRQFAPNVLRAAILAGPTQEPERSEGRATRPEWAQLAIANSSDPASGARVDLGLFAEHVAGLDIPVVAWRTLREPRPLEQARAAVDELQRDLAPHGDFAGYLV